MRKAAVLGAVVLAGCFNPKSEAQRQAAQAAAASTDCAGCATGWSAEQGFVVHEWGTLTLVLGSDGEVLPGLHHEEEDLPPFVTDRVKSAASANAFGFANTKMETPVTYFYAPSALTVSAQVHFPHGLLTQWYPAVQRFAPVVFGDAARPNDGWSRLQCAQALGTFPDDSALDWGSFQVLGRGAAGELPATDPKLSWDFARQVQANTLEVPHDGAVQRERFLFYRGLSEAPPRFRPRFEGEQLVLENAEALPRGGLVLMNVTDRGAGVSVLGDLAAGARQVVEVPKPTLALGDFVPKLKAILRERLTATGLYADEAAAMVNTWERSYFLTPGVRLLYLLPQRELDTVLPLTISPAPEVLLRAMVIRLELQPPSREAQLSTWLAQLAQPDTAAQARARFLALGRFAQPLLTRAQQLSTDLGEWAAADTLLTEVRGERRWSPVVAQ